MIRNSPKPWRDVVRPRGDLKSGELSLAMFAADLHDVAARRGLRPTYEDPAEFFALTYPTPNLRELARGVALRLAERSDKACGALSVDYGGGKTHTRRSPSCASPATRTRRRAFPRSRSSRSISASRRRSRERRRRASTRSTSRKGSRLPTPAARRGRRARHAPGAAAAGGAPVRAAPRRAGDPRPPRRIADVPARQGRGRLRLARAAAGLLPIERQERARYGAYRSRDLCLAWMNALAAGEPDARIGL